MKKQVYFFTSLLVACISFGGCGDKKSNGESESSNDSSIKIVEKPKTNTKSEVWIDASLSMKGYVATEEDPHFNGIIGALGKMEGNGGIALYSTSLGKSENYDDFNKKLQNKNIKWSDESKLTTMIKSAVDKSSSNLVFIITDGIMSGSNQEISSSPGKKFNILHRDQLTQELQSVLKGRKNVAINVSQYFMKFKGTYYCYDNYNGKDTYLNEKNRPLYIITVGPKDKVNDVIKNKFAKNDMLKTSKTLTFGDLNIPFSIKMNISSVNILSREKNTNNYSLNKKYIREQKIDELTFNLGVSMLPEYMKELEYFKKNGHMQSKRLKEGDNAYKDIKVNNIEYNNGKLSITINKSLINQVSLRYVLDYADPAWIKQSSTDDDKLKYSDQTTFNFEYFMKGLSVLNPEGYVNDVENTIINIIN